MAKPHETGDLEMKIYPKWEVSPEGEEPDITFCGT